MDSARAASNDAWQRAMRPGSVLAGRAVRLLVEDALDDGGDLGGAGAEVPGAGVQGGVAEEGLDLGRTPS
jgi:hypothetical protein